MARAAKPGRRTPRQRDYIRVGSGVKTSGNYSRNQQKKQERMAQNKNKSGGGRKLVGDSNTLKGVEGRIGGAALYGKKDSLGRTRNVSFDQFITAAGGRGATGKIDFRNDPKTGTRHGGALITRADGSTRFIPLGDAQRKYFYRQVKEGKSRKGKISEG